MKKVLLATSAFAIAFAGAAHADTPKITVGGFTDWQVGIVSEDNDDNQRSQAFFNDTEIHFNIDGKADNGLGYGAVIILEADVTDDFDNQGSNAAVTYVYLDGGWGRVELGSNVGASGTMKIDASSIARATGGVDGDFYRYIAVPASATNQFLITPDLPLAYGAGAFGDESTENINKITYYTPNFHGFQAGVSYAPADTDRGQTINRFDDGTSGTVVGNYENIFTGGVSYDGDVNGVGFGISATAETADAELGTNEDLFAWNVGAHTSFMGISLAGSYGDLGDLGTTASNTDADYYTLGAAYEFGPYGVSVNYIDSSVSFGGADNDFENIVVGVDYQLAPGLTPYAEINFFDVDGADAADDNDGTVFLLGTQLNF